MLATDLGNGIYYLDAEYVQPGLAVQYVMVENGEVALIETGTTHSVPKVNKVLAELGLSFADVRYVIPTHVHLDHAGGAGALMRECPNAELVIHPRGAAHMIDPSRLIAGTKAVYGEDNYRKFYGEIVPVPESRVVEADDGFSLELAGRKLVFIDTPGHALHHFCVWDAKSRGVFTGDTFGIVYPVLKSASGEPMIYATTTPTQFDPEAMQASIARILSYQPARAYLTHFGEVAITPQLVKQLCESVSGLAAVARELLGEPQDRERRLQQKVADFLVEQFRQYGCEGDDGFLRKAVHGDVLLNSQGLQVWLARQEKQAAESAAEGAASKVEAAA